MTLLMPDEDQRQTVKEKLAALSQTEREALLAKLKKMQLTSEAPAVRDEKHEHALTKAQQRLWTLEQFDKVDYLYHIPFILTLPLTIDKQRLTLALQTVCASHAPLRSFFVNQGEAVEQHEVAQWDGTIADISLTQCLPPVLEIDSNHPLGDFFLQPFALHTPPLFRVSIASAPDEHYLLICCHHLIMDAWSAGLFLQQLSLAYHTPHAQLTPGAYHEYVAWENKQLAPDSSTLHYWENRLKTPSWNVDLAYDHPRPKYLSGRGRNEWLTLSKDTFLDIVDYAKRRHVSVNHVVLAAFQLLLGRYSGQDDVTVGLPLAGRLQKRWQQTIGLFVNTCLHTRQLNYQGNFTEHIEETKALLLQDIDQSTLPYDSLIKHFYHHQLCAQGASFNILYNFIQTHGQEAVCFDSVAAKPLLCLLPMSKFDLSLHVLMGSEELTFLFEYSTDLFVKETIQQLLDHLRVYVKACIANESLPLAELMWIVNNN